MNRNYEKENYPSVLTCADVVDRLDYLKTEPHILGYTTGQQKRKRVGPEESSYEGIEAFEQRSASASARVQLSNRSYLKVHEEQEHIRKTQPKPSCRKFKVLLQSALQNKESRQAQLSNSQSAACIAR